jgi:hypothetical protein
VSKVITAPVTETARAGERQPPLPLRFHNQLWTKRCSKRHQTRDGVDKRFVPGFPGGERGGENQGERRGARSQSTRGAPLPSGKKAAGRMSRQAATEESQENGSRGWADRLRHAPREPFCLSREDSGFRERRRIVRPFCSRNAGELKNGWGDVAGRDQTGCLPCRRGGQQYTGGVW